MPVRMSLDFGLLLAAHNNKDVDIPSIGERSSHGSPIDVGNKNKQFVNYLNFQSATREIDSNKLHLPSSVPSKKNGKDSAFSKALQ